SHLSGGPLPILERGRGGHLGEAAGRQGLVTERSYLVLRRHCVMRRDSSEAGRESLQSMSTANTLVFYSRGRACPSNEKGAAHLVNLSGRYAVSWASWGRLRGDSGVCGLHRPIFHARRLEILHR